MIVDYGEMDYLDRLYDQWVEDQYELQYQCYLEDQYNDWLADQESVYMSRLWRE